MTFSDDSPISFRTCRTLDGRSESVSVGRRNGRLTVMLTPSWSDGGTEPTPSRHWIDDPRYYINLNEVERRTWRQILSAVSINTIAAQEGVSRAAVYSRIQGNSKGQGGMIAKNFWCLLWWRLRQEQSEGHTG